LTTPSVSFPDHRSGFNTLETRKPGLVLIRAVPSILPIVPFLSPCPGRWGSPGGAAGSLLPYCRRPCCPGLSSWSRWPATYPLSVGTAVPTIHSV